MTNSPSIGNQRTRPGSRASNTSTHNVQAPSVSDIDSECTMHEQGNCEKPRPGDQPLDMPGSATHPDENEETILTSIRATDLTLGLRRIPAGFYAVVYHSGLEWRTENKQSSVTKDVIEWDGLIPIPSDPSAAVSFEINASFELQPMLGNGELLRKLTVTVEQLLDHNGEDLPFAFFPEGGDVVSPCSSLSVTLRRGKRENSHSSSMSMVLDPHYSTTESRGQLESATNEGHGALSRYLKHGQNGDLERSIERFGCALNLCPLEHSCRAAAQSNMAMAKLIYCWIDDTDIFLDVPMILYRNALSTRPVGHRDRPSTLIQLATVHFARFEKRQDEVDAAQAEALLHEAMKLSSKESHESRAAVFMLQLYAGRKLGPTQAGVQSSVERDPASYLTDMDRWTLIPQLLERFQRFSEIGDLQQAISLLEASVRSASVGGHVYLAGVTTLGMALSYRFRQLGELSDLEEAISRQQDALNLTPAGHPDRPGRLNNLGNSFRTRFERLGNLHDLEQAISRFRDAVNLNPEYHSHKHTYLSNLGNSLLTRFERLGELGDLEQAISRQQDIIDFTLDGRPCKPAHLSKLANSFRARFERLGELSDLEQAISRQRKAIDLTPDGHRDKPDYLNDLGISFVTLFERLGEQSDLEQAISRFRDAIGLTPDGHPDKPGYLNNLGNSLLSRYRRLGELSDLEQAISRQRDAANLTPDGHSLKPRRLNNLGNSFRARFERLGELSDLEQAISRQRNAVDLAPDGHPDKPICLSNLGNSLRTRFERLGELSDIEQAILWQQDAVDFFPDGHLYKPLHLNHLGNSFITRFGRLGELRDLEQAISRFGDAVALTPDGHLEKPGYLSNLGNCFRTRFKHLGELRDLEHAISRHQDAVDLTPDGHPHKPGCLNNLGSSFGHRFERLGESSDLEHAISRFGDAVQLSPNDHPDGPTYLSNLGASLRVRFEHIGELGDLEHAISRQRDAVDLIPDDHPRKPRHLNDLGNSLRARFERLGELSDLEQAISRFVDAVDLTPDCHPEKPLYLNNLGSSLVIRFRRLGEPSDLEHAISRQQNAVDLTPSSHPSKLAYLYNLGNSFIIRFEHLGESSDLEHAISLHSEVACGSTGPTSTRFNASKNWISCARASGHHSLLHAYSSAIRLLPQLAWIGLSLTDRYRELVKGADVVREAAAAALDSGLPELAVEWLEQGRSIVWGELFQLRSSYDELSVIHPGHARRLRELSAALEHASTAREKSLPSASEATETLEQEANRHRTFAIERDSLVQEIRRLPGFERFLLHKEFSQLCASAHSGPIVILNAAKHRCDALIILADMDNVIHVPLPKFTLARSESLQTSLKSMFRREGRSKPQQRPTQWESMLSVLWKSVAKPVLDSLAISTPGDLSRIFWCPTGPFTFLPIHAAGFYNTMYSQAGHKVFDFVVSSYVPTLSILAPSLKPDTASSDDLRFLAVRQPSSDGLSPLPGVHAELQRIKAIIQDSPSARTTFLESSVGTVEEVLDLMKEAHWVHFACHGIQDAVRPTDSGLCLANRRRLKISDIIALSRPRGGLAFLSACQTATGDRNLSDEAIHITAGMLFAGYGGVVGTMWSISDKLAPHVAKGVYERLFQKGRTPDYREAARALQDAVGHLRNDGASFIEWLPFIHVGL